MKKVLCVLFFSVLCLGFCSVSHASVDQAYEVAVIDLKGDVQVDAKGDGSWTTPTVGMKLMKDSVVKTGAGSYIDVVYDAEGLNVLRIKENTHTIIRLASVDLKDGSVIASFANMAPGGSFSVKTPTAVCGIRGSGMGVDFINNMTIVSAFEHSVFVQGVDQNGNPVGMEVVIPEGWKTQVLDNGDTTPPEGLTDNELAIFDAWVASVVGGTGGEGGFEPEGEDENDLDGKDLEEKKDISPSA